MGDGYNNGDGERFLGTLAQAPRWKAPMFTLDSRAVCASSFDK